MQEHLEIEKIPVELLAEKVEIVDKEEVREVPIAEFLYTKFTAIKHPNGFVCIDQEKQLYQRLKPFSQLSDQEKEIFVIFGDMAKEYFETPSIENTVPSNSPKNAELYP